MFFVGWSDINNPEQPYYDLAVEFRRHASLVACEVNIPVTLPDEKFKLQPVYIVIPYGQLFSQGNRLVAHCRRFDEESPLHQAVLKGNDQCGWIKGGPNPSLVTMDAAIGRKCIQDMNAQVADMGKLELEPAN